MSEAPASAPSRCEHCGQLLPKGAEWRSRYFRLGVLATIVLLIPFGFGFANAIRSISATRATGMGAVAGGLSEVGVAFGLIAMVVFAVSGIVFFVRGFAPGKHVRAIVSVLGIIWCGFVLVSTSLTMVLLIYFSRQHP